MSTNSNHIPKEVTEDEIVLRTIFSPANIKNGKLKSNFMRPPIKYPDEDNPNIASNKLSVTRLKYMGIEFCRQHGKLHSSLPLRSYWGFAKFVVGDIRFLGADVIASPSRNNKGHTNIVLPFRQAIGEPLPAQMLKLAKDLADCAEVIQDPDINAPSWTGRKI